jgi:predicted glycosyltransferase
LATIAGPAIAGRSINGRRRRAGPTPRLRIALYSHDALGLGHLRRNIAIATALAVAGAAAILLICGAREAGLFELPPGVDVLALPALRKRSGGGYRSRSLGLELAGMVALRGRILRSALGAFAPHALIVDKLPSGVESELSPSFGVLHDAGTRLVLGLREVLDEPARVREEWRQTDFERLLRDHYDAVWVYGDPRVYDPVVEYGMADDVAGLVRYTGYLNRNGDGQRSADPAVLRAELGLPAGPLCLCTVGGGEDGYRLADAFARAALPPGASGVIVTGPFMPAVQRRAIERLAARRGDLSVLSFVPDADALMGAADQVVAMGGYNTVCEALARGRRALIVPRTQPRREQLIRAQRLAALGAVDLLAGHATPAALAAWMALGPRDPEPLAQPIDLDGLPRLPAMLQDVLALEPAHA